MLVFDVLLVLAGMAAGSGLTLLAGRRRVRAAEVVAAPEVARAPTVLDARPRTDAALRALGAEGWIVLRDLPGPWGVREHVLVGAAGVFLLDSRALAGTVEVDGDHVVARDGSGRVYRRDVGGRLRTAATALFRELRHRGGVIEPVHAIAVVWGDLAAPTIDGDRVTYVSGDHLADHLRSRPRRLTEAQVAALAHALRTTAAAA